MNLRSILAALAVSASFGQLGAAGILFSHEYGEIVDRGSVIATLYSSTLAALECPSNVTQARTGNRIVLTTRAAPSGQTSTGACQTASTIRLGAIPAGTYEVTGQIQSPEGLTLESATAVLRVLPIEGRCNDEPRQDEILATLPNGGAEEYVARVRSDRSLAVSLGVEAANVSIWGDGMLLLRYPPLQNMTVALDRLITSGAFADAFRFDVYSFGNIGRYDPGNSNSCGSDRRRDVAAPIVEYFSAALDHYFYTGDSAEVSAIDTGKVGPGWTRTGRSFNAVVAPGCPFAHGQSVVYRFNGIPGKGPDSHFFTRDRAECSVVDESAKWSFEGLPFWASALNADGTCDPLPGAGPRVPLYRMWRPFGDSNHRFSTDRAVIDEMMTRGWVNEGAAMCVMAPG